MRNDKELIALLSCDKKLAAEVTRLNEQRLEIRQKIAEANCPFTVGEKVINGKGVLAVVEGILYGHNNSSYRMSIRKIRKDGKPYKESKEAFRFEDWQLAVNYSA